MKNIWVDVSACNSDLKCGISNLIVNLLRRMIAENDYNVMPFILASEINNENIAELNRQHIYPAVKKNKIKYFFLQYFFSYIYRRKMMFGKAGENISIYPANFIHFGKSKGKSIVILHDVIPFTEIDTPKATYKRKLVLKLMKHMMSYAANKADTVITVSEFSKNDIIKYTGCRGDNIHVMPLGVEKFENDTEMAAKVRQKYSLPEKYIIYIGGLSERKNLRRLLLAFDTLVNTSRIDDTYHIAIVGNKEKVISLVASLDLSKETKDRIVIPGFVDEEEKGHLYHMATYSIYPSLYEGFGLPVIEAMSAGTPVITSNVTSMPEASGGAALLCDPYSVEDIADKMELLANDEILQKKLIEKGYERADALTWDNTYKVLKKIIDN